MITVVILTLYGNLLCSFVNLDIHSVGYYGQTKVLSDLGTNLSGITVDSLTTGDDQVVLKIADSACDGGGSSPGISTAQSSVGNQDCLVSAHCYSFLQHICCLGKTHGKYGNLCTVLILKTKSSLKTCLVIRVHYSEHCCSV